MFTSSFLPISYQHTTSISHAHSKCHLSCSCLVSTPPPLPKSSKQTVFHAYIQTEYSIYSHCPVKITHLLPMFENNTTPHALVQSVNHHYSLAHSSTLYALPTSFQNTITSAHVLLVYHISITDEVIDKRHQFKINKILLILVFLPPSSYLLYSYFVNKNNHYLTHLQCGVYCQQCMPHFSCYKQGTAF